jgi:death-on-curing protein
MDGDPIFLSRAEVDDLHSDSLKLFGGIAGVRDDSLVESAMGAAMNEFFYGQGDLFSVAAVYAFHIAQNQAFLDGNKRTAASSALAFLAMNGFSHSSTGDEQLSIYNALIAIAERRMTKPELAELFRTLFTAQ